MAIIETLDNFNSDSELAPTQANFPALQHFWRCDEASGLTTIADYTGDVAITTPTSIAQSSGLEGLAVDISMTVSTGDAVSAGTLASPSTKDAFLFVVADFTSGAGGVINIGSLAGVGAFQFNATNSTSRVWDGTNTLVHSAITYGSAVEGHAIAFTSGSGSNHLRLQADGTYSTTAATGTPPTSITLEQKILFGNNGAGTLNKLHGCALFYFDTLPSANDLKTAMLWMYADWTNATSGTEPSIYPGWRGKS